MSRCIFLLIAALLGAAARGQEREAPRLTLPQSPAFSMLQFEPAAVLKPTSQQALVTDILGAFDPEGKLVPNMGLEVAPYWLRSRPMLTRDQYLNPDRYPFQTLKQSFTLSMATTKDSAAGDTRLGAGFRLQLLRGAPADTLLVAQQQLINWEEMSIQIGAVRRAVLDEELHTRQECIQSLAAQLEARRRQTNAYTVEQIQQLMRQATDLSALYTDTKQDLLRFLEALTNLQVSTYDAAARQVSLLTDVRKGWIVDVAGGTAFNAGNGADFHGGLWLNAGIYVSPSDLISLTARLLWTNSAIHSMKLDVGAAYCKQTARFNFSLEAMFRWYTAELADWDRNGRPIRRVERDVTYRIALQSSYRLTTDIGLNLSIGKNFDDPGMVSGNTFFSILGFNYSIFQKQYVALGQ